MNRYHFFREDVVVVMWTRGGGSGSIRSRINVVTRETCGPAALLIGEGGWNTAPDHHYGESLVSTDSLAGSSRSARRATVFCSRGDCH